jgi:fatty acid desaturase
VTVLFPALQLAAFALSCALAGPQPLASALLFLAACVLLCASVHVSIHEVVHRRGGGALTGPLMTLVIGLPFEGYRWHHWNHHRWNNRLEDYSTTWRATRSGPRPWPMALYVLAWSWQLVRSGLAMRSAATRGEVPLATQRAIRREQATLLLTVCVLLVAVPTLALRYVALVYIGWALIALHNYRQHPPRRYGADIATSYYGALYNRLLFRNGLHAEHHDRPQVPWHAIAPFTETRTP